MALEPSQYGSAAILNDRAIQERIATSLEAQLGGRPINSGVDSFCVTYIFPDLDIGAGTKTEDIEGVQGYRGKVVSIQAYNVTEVWSDTDSEVDIGDQASDPNAYVDGAEFGELLAQNDALTLSLVAGVADSGAGTIPLTEAGQNIIVTVVTPTTGTTGIATFAVTIQYFR